MKVNYLSFKGICHALVLTLLSVATLSAQRVNGVVTDAESNEVLPGATIVVKNEGRGTATDSEGKFSLEASEGEVLTVSLVG